MVQAQIGRGMGSANAARSGSKSPRETDAANAPPEDTSEAGLDSGAWSQQAAPRAPGAKPSWSITKLAATGTIVLRFVGPTRTPEIAEFLAALTEMMPQENANIVFDLRRLVGHNPDTKQPIKKWLIEHRPRIGQITVVVPKAAIIQKIATAVIGLASGVKIRVRDDLAAEALVTEL